MITVYYDGKCGLCATEINHYRKIAPEGIFHWQDITELSGDSLKELGISLAQGLLFLHAKDQRGCMHVGVDAFILIWQQLKWWRLLAVFIGLPVVRPFAQGLYKIFAHWRFKKLSHCQMAVKSQEQ